MRLYDEILKGADGLTFGRCIFIPKGGGYFEGVRSIGDFSPERVVVCFSKLSVAVEGSFLCIKKYCDGDLQLGGKILSVTVVDEGGV